MSQPENLELQMERLCSELMVLMSGGTTTLNSHFRFDPSSLQSLSLEERGDALGADFDDEEHEADAGHKIYIPKCTCDGCFIYFYTPKDQQDGKRRYTSRLSAKEVSRILDSHADAIFTSQARLKRMMEQHGERLSHYWRASGHRKRGALLRAVYPEMPQSRCTDVGKSLEEIRHSAHRKALLLPYLDSDTLSRDPEALLGLVRNRILYHPEMWADFDNEQLRRSWSLGVLDSQFSPGTVLMHGHHYGRYAPWSRSSAHRLETVGFPRGRLIIEAQASLMIFLRDMIEELSQTSDGFKVPKTTLAPALLTNDKFWSEIARQPFVAPASFDLDAMLALAKGRTDALADHLWLLQTEPSYLQHRLRDIDQTQSVQPMTKPLQSETKSTQSKLAELPFRVAFWELSHDFNVHMFWHGALLELEHVKDTYQRFSGSIVPESPLPEPVDEAFAALEGLLLARAESMCFRLRTMGLPQRPQFQHLYKHDKPRLQANGTYSPSTDLLEAFRMATKSGAESAKLLRKEKLWWILNQLVQSPSDETRFSHTFLLGLLNDYFTTTTPEKRSALDQFLYEQVSDYIAYFQLLSAVQMLRPRFRSCSAIFLRDTQDRYAWRTTRISTAEEIASENPLVLDLGAITQALRHFRSIAKPAGAQNEKWLVTFNKQHTAMQNFWAVFSAVIRGGFKMANFSDQDLDVAMASLSFSKAPDYLARLDSKREDVLATLARAKAANTGHPFLPLPSAANLVKDRDRLELDAGIKTKVKTRGSLQERTEDIAPIEAGAEECVPTIVLSSKRSLATFRAMFPSNPQESNTKVDWSTLANSMGDAGFAAKSSGGGGSSVKFEHRAGNGSINFHRPHPEPVVEPLLLQAFGRRMSKHFGWTRETFVLEKK